MSRPTAVAVLLGLAATTPVAATAALIASATATAADTATAAATATGAPAAAGPHQKFFAGLIADVPSRKHIHRSPLARIANLPTGGGPVLHANRPHVIFWQPDGSGLGFDPGYQSLVERFLADVAADSHKPTNVYGLSGQYYDSEGPAAYNSTYGGSVVATDPLPANGCSEPLGPPLGSGPGWSRCMSDQQLVAELQHVIRAQQLPTTSRDVYFLVTPNGLGSCESGGTDYCALGGTDNSGSYCGYHSSTPDGVLYAVIPYNAVPGHCQSGNPRPNSNAADPAVSTISHEHNEMVTDPLGDAWVNGSSNSENGDLCITYFGPIIGGSGATAFNETIHGNPYFLQEEWSNDDRSCQPRDELDTAWFTAPSRPRAHGAVVFTAHAADPDGSIVAYRWFFGDGTGRSHRASHAFRRAGAYRVVLRTTDSAGNWAYAVHTIRVSRGSRRRSHLRRP